MTATDRTVHAGPASAALARVEALAATNPRIHISTTGSWLDNHSREDD